MEWTKDNLKNTCISTENMNQSNKILKFYQSFGYFLKTKTNWKCPKNTIGGYIGPSELYENEIVHIYWPTAIENKQVIKLPKTSRRKFPREMMVSNEGNHWFRRTVIGKIKNEKPYVTKSEGTPSSIYMLFSWALAKEI